LAGFTSVSAYSANEICDTGLQQRIKDALQRNATAKQDALHQALPGPADRDQIANTPCVSRELDNITGQFSDQMGGMLGGLGGGLNFGGDAGDILNNFFQSGFESLNEAASTMPAMLNFQSQASNVLGDLLGSLGGLGGTGFNSELCGMMIDMVLKYIQCQVPLELPDLGSGLNASLNIDLPDNCAGNALRDSMYEISNSRAFETLAQPMDFSGGQYTPGTADFRNGD